MESLALFACALFAVFDSGARDSCSHALGLATLTALLTGLVLVYLGRGKIDRIPRREGVIIVGVGWMASGIDWSDSICFGGAGIKSLRRFL